MVRTIGRLLLICWRRETLYERQLNDRSFTHCSKRAAASFTPQGNRGRTGYSFGSLFSKDGLFELEGLVLLSFSKVMTTGLFFGASQTVIIRLGLTAALDLEVVHTLVTASCSFYQLGE